MVSADVKVNPRIKSLEEAFKLDMGDMKRLEAILGTQFRSNMRRQFKTEGDSGGSRWAPLSPKYRKWKARKYPGRKILTRTGATRKAFTHRRNSKHVERSFLIPRPTVVLGAQSRVAAYHAPGVLHNPRLPVRDPIQTSPRQDRRFIKLIREFHVEKLKRVNRALIAGQAEMQGNVPPLRR